MSEPQTIPDEHVRVVAAITRALGDAARGSYEARQVLRLAAETLLTPGVSAEFTLALTQMFEMIAADNPDETIEGFALAFTAAARMIAAMIELVVANSDLTANEVLHTLAHTLDLGWLYQLPDEEVV